MAYRFIVQRRYFALLSKIPTMANRNSHQIAKEIGMSGAHFSRVLSEWAARGYLQKQEKDGRAINIKLTEKGQELLKLLISIDNLTKKQTKAVEEEPKTKQNKN